MVVETAAETPMGATTDLYVLDAASLRPRSREVHQGPATILVEYGDDAITGKLSAGPQEMPIEQELEAPVFGGDGALHAVIAALPLTEGYKTTLRTFEVGMQQRVRVWSVAVAGSESTEVPAGSYETWKVEVEALDGEGGDQAVWVTRETPRMVVRSESDLPAAMGGGTVATVLLGEGAASSGEAAE
jgi:hypothetical protein